MHWYNYDALPKPEAARYDRCMFRMGTHFYYEPSQLMIFHAC